MSTSRLYGVDREIKEVSKLLNLPFEVEYKFGRFRIHKTAISEKPYAVIYSSRELIPDIPHNLLIGSFKDPSPAFRLLHDKHRLRDQFVRRARQMCSRCGRRGTFGQESTNFCPTCGLPFQEHRKLVLGGLDE